MCFGSYVHALGWHPSRFMIAGFTGSEHANQLFRIDQDAR
jgi:hypothetical protein